MNGVCPLTRQHNNNDSRKSCHGRIYDAFGQLVAEYGQLSQTIGGVKYIQQDHQGSVRTVTDAHGNIVSRSDYQAFGDELGSGVGLRTSQQGYGGDSVARQGYGLTEKDHGTGQQHTWFRKLETQAGRWSSPDPSKGSMNEGDPQSFNRYSYVGSDPANSADPSGLMGIQTCTMYGGELQCQGSGDYYGADRAYGSGILTITEYRRRLRSEDPKNPNYQYLLTTSFSPFSNFGGPSNWDAKARRAADVAIESLKKPNCLKLFSIFGTPSPSNQALPGDGSPGSALGIIRDRKQIRHNTGGFLGHAVLQGSQFNTDGAYAVRQTILVGTPFFDNARVGGSITFNAASSAQIAALSPDQARALILLHELMHLYYDRGHETAEPGFQDGSVNDHILWNCF